MVKKRIVQCDNCCKEIHGEYFTHNDSDYCTLECMAKDCCEYGVARTK